MRISEALNLAIRDFEASKFEEARSTLLAAEGLGTSPKAVILLSYIESYLGSYRLARDYAQAASKLKPDSAETIVDIAARLRTFNLGKDMIAYLEKLGSPSNLSIPMLLQCAAQFSYLNLQDRALQYLEEAYKADPAYPPTQLSYAQILIYHGNAKRAAALLADVSMRHPNIPDTYQLIASLGVKDRGTNRFDVRVEKLLESGSCSPPNEMKLAFAQHRLLDDRAEFPRAYQALERGLQLRRASLQYSTAESTILVEKLKSLVVSSAEQRMSSVNEHTPIFIVGMHRSGTTLLEQLLSASPKVQGIGELYDFTSAMREATDHHCKSVIDLPLVERALARPLDYESIGQSYLKSVAWRLSEKEYFTDKLPSNFMNIGFLAQALPNAKVIHMVRDPMETCFSNLRELFSSANSYSYDQEELGDFYALYLSLMAHWHNVFPGRILDVDYGRLTTDTEAVMKEVATYCGLEFQAEMVDTRSSTRGVATASAVQVREKISSRDTPKWKPYERELAPLRQTLSRHGICYKG